MYKLGEKGTNDEESIEESLLVILGPDEEFLEESSAPVTSLELVNKIKAVVPNNEILQRIMKAKIIN